MKASTILRYFETKDGTIVKLRAPSWSDIDDMVEFVNSLVHEGALIGTNKIITRDMEIDWISKHLTDIERDKKIGIVAEVKNKLVGQIEVRLLGGSSGHVGQLVIALSNDYRSKGIGTEMIKEAEDRARLIGCKIMTLEVYANNTRAINLYKRLGYHLVGSIPKGFLKDGNYIDKTIMVKEI